MKPDIGSVVRAKGGEKVVLIGFEARAIMHYDGESDVTGFVDAGEARCCATLTFRGHSTDLEPNFWERVEFAFAHGPVIVPGKFAWKRETSTSGQRYRRIYAKIEEVHHPYRGWLAGLEQMGAQS